MGVKTGFQTKAAVSRAVRLRECPLRELRLYLSRLGCPSLVGTQLFVQERRFIRYNPKLEQLFHRSIHFTK